MAEAILGEKERYSCAICLDLMKDPVTIPCGHSYCMKCIEECWNTEDHRKAYSCPQCRKTFNSKPSLNRSTVLAEIMGRLRNTPHVSESKSQSLAGPEDIACDFCHERKLKAIKSCLVCQCSYCENHLHPHYTVPALKKHKLVKAAIMATCSTHDKLLEVYCRTDQKCVCMLCLLDDHKGHDTVPSAVERNEKQVKLKANQARIYEIILAKEFQKVTFDTTNLSHSSKMAVEDSQRVFTEFIRFFEKRSTEMIEKIEGHQKADLDQYAKHQEKLMVEISELLKTNRFIEKLLQTEDNIYFLQNFESVSSSSASEDLPSLFYKKPYMDVSKLVTELKERLESVCNEEINKTFQKISDLFTKSTPVSLIKIGDRVRVKPSVLNPIHGWGNVTHKSVGVVQDIKDNESLFVCFPTTLQWRGILSEMELVTDDGSSTLNYNINVGDKVCVKPSVVTPKYLWGSVNHKSIGVVTDVQGQTVEVDFPGQKGWKGDASEMEPVVNVDGLSINDNLQIGNKVRVRTSVSKPTRGWGGVTHHSIGVIKDIQGESLTVDFPQCKYWKGIVSEMELVRGPGSESSTCSRFQIGNKVRVSPSVSKPKHGWGGVTHNSIGVISNIRGESLNIDFPECKNWNGEVSEIELVRSPGSEVPSLSVGSKVRVKSSITAPAYGWGNVTKDCIGVVKAIDGTKVNVAFPRQSNWTGIISDMEAL